MKEREPKGEAKPGGKVRRRARWLEPSRRLLIGAGAAVVVAILIAIVLIPRIAPPPPPVDTLPISELLNRAEQHQIAAVTIEGDLVDATTRTGYRFQSIKESGSPITDELRRDGVAVVVRGVEDSSPPIASLFALIMLFTIGGLAIMGIKKGGIGGTLNTFGRSNARLLTDKMPPVTFSDVAGVDEAKLELQEIVHFLRDPGRFRRLGARAPKGILLVGPPGTGKTLISKAVAGESGVPFFSISGSEFVEMFVGVGASRVRDLFRQAKKQAPCIVFIDEIDAVGRQRGVNVTGNDEREQTLNQLLVEMDGFDSGVGIVVLAATNRPDILDQALLRPGRFDRRVSLDPPDVNGRLEILRVHAQGKPIAPEVELLRIARQTPGFSGADLENVVNEAAILAARGELSTIGLRELEEGVMRVMAGPERKSRVIGEYEKSIIAYHEVGHALVMRAQKHSNTVEKISIISRGQALGLTMQVPEGDRYLTSRAQLLAQMASLLGGRAAEELVFGDVTTGARQDLSVVNDIARKMVLELGMSSLGIVPSAGGDSGLGEEMASRVDAAIKALIDDAAERASSILRSRHDKLVEIAEHLKAVETIDAEEFKRLIGPDWQTIDAETEEIGRVEKRPGETSGACSEVSRPRCECPEAVTATAPEHPHALAKKPTISPTSTLATKGTAASPSASGPL